MAEFFETGICARTNGAGLAKYEPGKMVSVVGRVTGENAIETSDGVAVSISAHSLEFPASGCVEVVGTIEDGACLSPTRFCSFGEEFDLKNYDDLVGHIEGKYKDLFQ